jgi:hypothetical protein
LLSLERVSMDREEKSTGLAPVRRNLSEQRKPRGGDGEQGPDFLICVHELHRGTVAEDFGKVQLRGRWRECLGDELKGGCGRRFFCQLGGLGLR